MSIQVRRLEPMPWCTMGQSFSTNCLTFCEAFTSLSMTALASQHGTCLDLPIFSDFENATSIDLEDNDIFGTITAAHFAGLVHLQFLDLRDNKLAAIGEGAFANLPSLVHIELGRNPFVGTVPKSAFAGLPALDRVLLQYTEISFIEADTFSDSPHITAMLLNHNNLQGDLEHYRTLFANKTMMNALSFNDNDIHGTIASDLLTRDMPILRDIGLRGNRFYGTLPPTLFHGLNNLWKFNIRLNNMTGTIHQDTFLNLPSFERLDLAQNGFTGPIPALSHVNTDLFLRQNNWDCPIPNYGSWATYNDYDANMPCIVRTEGPTATTTVQPTAVETLTPVRDLIDQLEERIRQLEENASCCTTMTAFAEQETDAMGTVLELFQEHALCCPAAP